jgi:hypothetical protein
MAQKTLRTKILESALLVTLGAYSLNGYFNAKFYEREAQQLSQKPIVSHYQRIEGLIKTMERENPTIKDISEMELAVYHQLQNSKARLELPANAGRYLDAIKEYKEKNCWFNCLSLVSGTFAVLTSLILFDLPRRKKQTK